jgi:hypothetical protein
MIEAKVWLGFAAIEIAVKTLPRVDVRFIAASLEAGSQFAGDFAGLFEAGRGVPDVSRMGLRRCPLGKLGVGFEEAIVESCRIAIPWLPRCCTGAVSFARQDQAEEMLRVRGRARDNLQDVNHGSPPASGQGRCRTLAVRGVG